MNNLYYFLALPSFNSAIIMHVLILFQPSPPDNNSAYTVIAHGSKVQSSRLYSSFARAYLFIVIQTYWSILATYAYANIFFTHFCTLSHTTSHTSPVPSHIMQRCPDPKTQASFFCGNSAKLLQKRFVILMIFSRERVEII